MDLVPQHIVRKDLASDLARRDTPRDYSKLGEKLGATVVVSGVVSEYRYRRSLGESPVIGFTINFINVKTGEIFWGANTHDEGVRILTYRGSLSELSQKLARRIVRQFNSK